MRRQTLDAMNALGDINCLMKTQNTVPIVPNITPVVPSGFTLGLDLGDRAHHVCVLDAAGNIVREASLPNTRDVTTLEQAASWKHRVAGNCHSIVAIFPLQFSALL